MISHECRVAWEASVSKQVILRERWSEVFSQLSRRTREERLLSVALASANKAFWFFFPKHDKTSALEVFCSCSFILRAHFETSLLYLLWLGDMKS